jgi:AraC-like DNA-binding protein
MKGANAMRTPEVDMTFARPLLRELSALGCPMADVLREAALSPAQLAPRIRTLPEADFTTLYSIAIRRLEQSTRLNPSVHTHTQETSDLMAYCVAGSETLHEGIDRMRAFNEAIFTGSTIDIVEAGDEVQFRFDTHRRDRGAGARLVDLTVLVVYHRLFGWLTGAPLTLRSAGIVYQPPEEHLLLADSLGVPLRYAQTENYLTLSKLDLSRTVIRTQADLAGIAGRFPFNLCFDATGDRRWSSQIEALLMEALQNAQALPSSAALAGQLHMSNATLRRRLRAEATNYAAIRIDCQRRLAESLLASTRMTINEIADRVGLSDDRAFRRAFGRWTGKSPGQYRRLLDAACNG